MQDEHVVILVGPRFCYFHKGILCEESVAKISCRGKFTIGGCCCPGLGEMLATTRHSN